MNSDLINWYWESKEVINRIVHDEMISVKIIHNEMFKVVKDCFEEGILTIDCSDFFENLIYSLFDSLGARKDLNISFWKEFYLESEEYRKFDAQYQFSHGWGLRETGLFWPKFVDEMSSESAEKQLEIISGLTKFLVWVGSYCSVFAYQYHISNYHGLRFMIEKVALLQYWEYKEFENYIDKLEDLAVDDKVEKITRMYAEGDFDERFPDRESLFFDFVRKGISVPEALKMIKLIRCGRSDKLSEHMMELLYSSGYEEIVLKQIMEIRYLKSKSNAIIKLLYISKLGR